MNEGGMEETNYPNSVVKGWGINPYEKGGLKYWPILDNLLHVKSFFTIIAQRIT